MRTALEGAPDAGHDVLERDREQSPRAGGKSPLHLPSNVRERIWPPRPHFPPPENGVIKSTFLLAYRFRIILPGCRGGGRLAMRRRHEKRPPVMSTRETARATPSSASLGAGTNGHQGRAPGCAGCRVQKRGRVNAASDRSLTLRCSQS